MNITLQILTAIFAGALAGYLWPQGGEASAVLGDIFLAALKMLIMPLIITSMLNGIASIGSIKRLGRLGGKTILYYISTTLFAVIIGLILVNTFKPGKKPVHKNADTEATRGMTDKDEKIAIPITTVSDFLHKQIKMIFMNPFRSIAEDNVLGTIIFSIILGIALLYTGENANSIFKMVNVLFEAVMSMVNWVMYIAPLGVFGLMAEQVAKSGLGIFVGLARYIAVVLAGLGIHAVLTLPLILHLIGRYSPLKLFLGIKEALLVAFSTSSSSATMPITMANLEENLHIPDEVVGFVIPLGATINMDGTALYEAVAALFIAQIYSVELGFTQQVIIALTATLAAVGAAGIPSAGLVTMAIVLTSVNLPLEGIGIILAVDRILDMCRTTINVYGDAVGAVVISRFFNDTKMTVL